MAPTRLARRRRWSPPPYAQIDPTHALSRGLLNVFWGCPPVSALGFEAFTLGAAFVPEWTPVGVGTRSPGIDISVRGVKTWPINAELASVRPCSLFAAVTIDTTSEQGVVVGLNSAVNDSGIHLGVGGTLIINAGNNLQVLHGGIAFKSSGVAIGTGYHTIGATSAVAGAAFYIDGVQVATQGPSGASTNQPVNLVGFAQRTTSNWLSSGVTVAMGAAWAPRILTPTEFALLHQDPFAMLRW